ncbi:hypothetical protein KHC33_15075 [Methanospirillum sp. J.3.6.1-F.2.7.3]|uniref:Glycosyltransferase n=1 Tax=Methanospirillum purgamenti TaxID=2834276 RepID=A0A8E7AYG5_9EURY|nr:MULTISPECIES: hypothetical protein [Methanospirillum]MDX8548937.1 hypothetical protein [Methanospirillum hungatei]QVV88624.1 hypothetical protein KHC33_15075 [Methanospirillum sp. J.3.6.1-F.2.7.3]
MNVIVLDVHHPEDGRVNRHIKYVQSLGYNVIHINVNRYFPLISSVFFSKFGEKGFQIPIGDFSTSIKNRIILQFLFFTPFLSIKIAHHCKKSGFISGLKTIIHIHDYELLLIGEYLKFFLPGQNLMVYDRHEYLEIIKGEHLFFDHLPRFYEKISSNWINGLVDISENHLQITKKIFPNSISTVIPNYPDEIQIEKVEICDKIKRVENNDISVIYFGSLNDNLDRDIPLTLEVMEKILILNNHSKAFIGGLTSNPDLIIRMKNLEKKYPNRFNYLGFIPIDDVFKYTAQSTIGLFLLKPQYCVSGSSNKLFEYLRYGVIPVIRADIENPELLSECSLYFSKYEEGKDVIFSISQLIMDKERMKKMMANSYELGKEFSFDKIKNRYQQLYLDLFSKQ